MATCKRCEGSGKIEDREDMILIICPACNGRRKEMDSFLDDLRKEYLTQDNRMTAYPIYVTVQELVCIGVIAECYGVRCPYGDGETKIEYKHPDIEFTTETKDEMINDLKDWHGTDELNAEEINQIEEFSIGYIWHPVEFFLTIKGAEEYIKANQHNHGKLRTYVSHFERRNFEMNKLLKVLEFMPTTKERRK